MEPIGPQTKAATKKPEGLAVFLKKADLPKLIEVLQTQYDVIGPVLKGNAVYYGRIDRYEQLAFGIREVQEAGEYTTEKANDGTLFAYSNGADSFKRILHPSRLDLMTLIKKDGGYEISDDKGPARTMAFFGIRSCDLFGVHVLDKTFLAEPPDPYYWARRQGVFIVATNCNTPGATCFCASMGTGPKVKSGYDIRLTELPEGITLEPGTERGQRVLDHLPTRTATQSEIQKITDLTIAAITHMGRTLDVRNLVPDLRNNIEHQYWAEVMAGWCLSCTNCTMVCPTCFCYDLKEDVDIQTGNITRRRDWDSCFTHQFAEVHGGNFRGDIKSRYRHWHLHKLSYWVEQYGVFGCVGCGRCITWCPVRIDLTAVAKAVRREMA